MSNSERMIRTIAAAVLGARQSRRNFLQRALGAGMTLAAAEALLAPGAQAAGRQGGFARLGLAHGSSTDSLDPAGYPDSFTQTAFWGGLSNNLTEVVADGSVRPELAESYEASTDASTYIFRLRRGVTFHNGKELTAEDVIASIRHHMGEQSNSAAKSILVSILDIKADGPHAVVFTLSAPDADFPYILSDMHLPIMPSQDGVADWVSGARTGPFVLESFEPGVSAKLRRNPDYFKDGLPYFDEVEVLAIPDVVARMNALNAGEVDFIARPDIRTLDLLTRNPNVEVVELTGYGHYTLPMNVTVAPFDNVHVRKALKYAIDREEIVRKVFFGHASPGNDNPIAPSVKFAIDPAPIHSYDPDKAREHLRLAGLDSLTVDLSVANAAFEGAIDAALLIRESAARCGITVNVVREPDDAYWGNVWMAKPWCASYWSGRATIDWMFSTAYAGGAAWNETFWDHPRFNELLAAARGELDETKRAAMYAEMQQLLHDDGGAIVVVFNNYLMAHSKRLGHGVVAANWENDGMKIAERWWMA